MGFFKEELPAIWAKWWVSLWFINFATLAIIPFLFSFRAWLITATLAFGIQEGIGVFRHKDRFPPLTYVLRHFFPRWVTFVVIWALWGGTIFFWMGAEKPWRWAIAFGLLGWLTDHFTSTYSDE